MTDVSSDQREGSAEGVDRCALVSTVSSATGRLFVSAELIYRAPLPPSLSLPPFQPSCHCVATILWIYAAPFAASRCGLHVVPRASQLVLSGAPFSRDRIVPICVFVRSATETGSGAFPRYASKNSRCRESFEKFRRCVLHPWSLVRKKDGQ